MQTNRPLTAVTVTGPSCSGKSVLARALVATGRYREAVSTTTRAARVGEVDGVHYHFVSRDQFKEIQSQGRLVESINFAGDMYGVTLDEFEVAHQEGKHVVLVCDPNGVEQINHFGYTRQWKVVSVFLGISKSVALERFYDRFKSEPDPQAAIPRYTNRIMKVLTDERDWHNTFDYDAYLPHSTNENDTIKQIELIEECVARDKTCEMGTLRDVRPYDPATLERLYTKIRLQLEGHHNKSDVLERLSGFTS